MGVLLQLALTPLKFPSFLVKFFVLSLLFSIAASKSRDFLSVGSSLSVEDATDVLISPDNTFTCGFYPMGRNAYVLSIWYTHSRDRFVVWMANRDKPVNGRGSQVSLRRNGVLVLANVDSSTVWVSSMISSSVSSISSTANRAELLNTGNLVLKDPDGNILWQSFDSPTDTLLPNQLFTRNTKLVSKFGEGNFSSGYFSLFFDNNNALTLMLDVADFSTIYWPRPGVGNLESNGRTGYNRSRIAVFDDMGNFLSSDSLQFSASDMGSGIRRRLTVDTDGNLRLYSLENITGLWSVSWVALLRQCDVLGICGENGICLNTPEAKCSCPPGFEFADPGNMFRGCKPKFNQTCSNTTKSRQETKFVQLPQVDFYGYDIDTTIKRVTWETCMQICLDDCRCKAFSYRITGEGLCYPKSVLFNGFMSPNFPGSMHIKLPASVNTSDPAVLSGRDPTCGSSAIEVTIGSASMYETIGNKVKWVYLYAFAGAIGGIELTFIAIGWCFFGSHSIPASTEAGYRAISSHFRRFSYSELKKATKNFKEEVGKGASGSVYKGILADGRVVAVKRLELHSYQGEDMFWAEVSTIGEINHMNLVRMWGFCSEGKKRRLLVYAFMENRSLDRYLFSPNNLLKWKDRFKIALGTAKGLAYLHHECLEWVIHCDVKPENILLDGDFEPKIADFGLAKLCQRAGSNSSDEFSRIRGTKGYMAPEWALNHPITAKVDVYSYGVVILELVRGVRLSNWIVNDSEDHESELARIVKIAKTKMQSGEEDSLWMDEMVDPRLKGKFNRNQVATLVKIGISCVKEDRSQRPLMDSVVQSLLDCQDEGNLAPA